MRVIWQEMADWEAALPGFPMNPGRGEDFLDFFRDEVAEIRYG